MVNKVNNFLTKATSILSVGTALAGAARAIGVANTSFSAKAGNFPPGGEPQANGRANAKLGSTLGDLDWRVRLTLPPHFANSETLFSILQSTGGLVFPYTPLITIIHSANYQPIDVVHNNYQYLSYQNSKVEAITLTAKFYLEDSREARYWVAAVHFLRTLTKMSFGESSNLGAPPPVVKLKGYGDFVFNDVPVVLQSFSMELPDDVDYISTGLGESGSQEDGAFWLDADVKDGIAWAPVKSQFNLTLQPMYSREKVNKFNLTDFVNGNYVVGNKNGFM